MRQRIARYRRIAPLALTVASLTGGIVATGCSSGQPAPTTTTFSGAAQPAGSWTYPNGNLDNTRDAVGSTISSSNVASLKEAWTFKLAGTAATSVTYAGSLAAAPENVLVVGAGCPELHPAAAIPPARLATASASGVIRRYLATRCLI